MSNSENRSILALLVVTLTIVYSTIATVALGLPELWDRHCSSCHMDDSPTCAGCHNHRGEIKATPLRHQYWPGEQVEISFEGGTQPGWIRALLYDENGNEIDRLTGPSESGDDARGQADADSVAFPLYLTGRAPSIPGLYTWRAAYFGIFHLRDADHDEDWVSVTLRVADPDSAAADPSWGAIKAFYRR